MSLWQTDSVTRSPSGCSLCWQDMWGTAVFDWPCCSGSVSADFIPSFLHFSMAADPLTPAISDRICRHMNDDHSDAVLRYAHHYGGLTSATAATMTGVTAEAMTLEVNGEPVSIPFDHTLTDSEDAHRTLVAMLRAMPAGAEQGES